MPADTARERQLELLTEMLKRVLGAEGEALAIALLPWLSWRSVAGGQALFRMGDDAGELFFVVSGRLRALSGSEGRESAADGEITRGQTIGELEFLTGDAHATSVVAVRDSVLAGLSRETYEDIVHREPTLSLTLSRLIGDRLKRRFHRSEPSTRPTNICLLAITDDIDISGLAYALARHLSLGSRVLIIEQETAQDAQGGRIAGEGLSEDAYRQFTEWLDEVESSHEFLIFVADSRPGEWTRRCLRESDEVVLLARADKSPALHPIESYLADADVGGSCRRTLVLLHDSNERIPRGTRDWLARRQLAAHLHIRPALERDIARLARVLSGAAIGLVLSGGGARGFAHLGVLKALEEFGVPIDSIGGASIGAIMGAYCAFDLPAQTIIDQAREAFSRRPTGDFNLVPVISLVGGKRLKRVIDDAVVTATGERIDVEDTWKSFYCVVSNYTRAAETLVTRGDLAKWLRTSVSIPGVLPLVPHQGELMGDGGSFNNFPTDIMRRLGTGYLIGIDLLQRGFPVLDLDEVPSNFRLLLDRLRAGQRKKFRYPRLASTLVSATMLVSQARQREARQRADLCFTPEMKGIGMLDWSKFDTIVELGYRHASAVLWNLPAEEAARLRGAVAAVVPEAAEASWDDDFIVP